jgi:hypothetical protein
MNFGRNEHIVWSQCLNRGVKKMKKAMNQSPVVRVALNATMNRFFAILLLCMALPVLAPAQDPLSPANLPAIDTNAGHYPSNIWITDTMQKVRQDVGAPGTTHWGTFYGTQNEFVDFQIHFHDTGAGTANLSVTASDFVQTSPASFTISASSTNVLVYREAYMNVTSVSNTSNTTYNATGFYPDILVPAIDPYFNQTTNAWPFTVAASKNQSAWVDVHIPPAAPSGYYLGSVTVKSGSTVLATMPVIIGVWQWPNRGFMPSTATLPSTYAGGYSSFCDAAYGGYAGCSAYPGAGGNSETALSMTGADGAALMMDHRLGRFNPIYPPDTNPGSSITSYWLPYLTGSATGQHAKTILSGAKAPAANMGPNPSTTVSTYQNWTTYFNSHGILPEIYVETGDEPSTAGQWTNINNFGAAAHTAVPPMPTLVTTNLASATANSALSNVDIITVLVNDMDPIGGSNQRSTYNAWLGGSSARRVWSYQSCSSFGCGSHSTQWTWPNLVVDGKPAANRAQEWLTYNNNQSGELYYNTEFCWPTTQCAGNVWNNNLAFGGWGDGTLLYPSSLAGVRHVTLQNGSPLTTEIWIPSVRLKHIRDGMQDYEYLNALNVAGKGSLIKAQIASWITNSSTFETTGSGLQTARQNLGTVLHQLTYSGILLPPPTLSGTVQ